jgi:transketolase
VRLARNETFEAPFAPAGRGEVSWLSEAREDVCLVSVGEKPTQLCVDANLERPGWGHAHLCWVDDESLAGAAPSLAAAARRLVVVEESRTAGSVASALALLLPGHEIRAVDAGVRWPAGGGSHDEILAALGLTVSAVINAV